MGGGSMSSRRLGLTWLLAVACAVLFVLVCLLLFWPDGSPRPFLAASDEPGGRRVVMPAASLNGAQFSGVNLDSAVFRMSSMRGIQFRDASLRGADLTSTDLRGADFTGADLSGADLSRACLLETVFHDSQLKGVVLDGALFPEAAIAERDGIPSPVPSPSEGVGGLPGPEVAPSTVALPESGFWDSPCA